MAGPLDPFTPGATEDPTAGLPQPGHFEQLTDQWNTFLSDPRGRGAILQMGLALMQPRGFGDTGAGQVGRAIGAGGEQVGRREAMDIKEQEAASKQELRGAQAAAQEARAGTAAANANTAATRAAAQADRLQFGREQEAGRSDRAAQSRRIREALGYDTMRARVEGENRRARQHNSSISAQLPGFQPLPITPIPTREEWNRQHGLGAGLEGVDGGGGGGQPSPIPAPGVGPSGGRGSYQDAVRMLRGNPNLREAFDARFGEGAAARELGE